MFKGKKDVDITEKRLLKAYTLTPKDSAFFFISSPYLSFPMQPM
jgi:hypothetical protein